MKVKHFEVQIDVKEEKNFGWKKRFVVRMGIVIDAVFDTRILLKP
jgi:hypothetical protein